MNKKKLFAMMTALVLVAVVGVGATLAYFTDTTDIANVVTLGKVDVKLTEHEVKYDPDTKEWVQDEVKPVTESGLEFTDVLPGETVPKDPTVSVADDSADCYIRVKVEVTPATGSAITQTQLTTFTDALKLQIEGTNVTPNVATNWTYNADGYYYFGSKLVAGDTALNNAVLFDTVTIPAAWGKTTAQQSFQIKISAEAVQADYLTDVLTMDASGQKVIGWNMDAVGMEELKAEIEQ